MSNDTRHPTPPGDAPALDRLLAGLGRLSPRRGFEQRVLALVRMPLPRWAWRIREVFRGLTSGPRGWVILGTFSLATATAWFGTAAFAFRFRHTAEPYVIRGSRILTEIVEPVWGEMLAFGAAQRAAFSNSVTNAFGGLGVSWPALAIGYGVLVVVSAIGLRLFMNRHAKANG
jgi:hypothetical protein